MLVWNQSKKIAAFVVAAVLLMPSFTVLGDDEDLKGQLSDIQSQMAEQAQRKSEAEAQISNIFDTLKGIQENLDAAQAEYNDASQKLAATESEISANEKKLDEAQRKLDARQKVFSKRIRDIYMHGQLSYLDVALGASDFSDFANRVELLRRVIAADMGLISSIKEQRDEIEAVKKVLEADRQRQQALKEEADQKRSEIQKHKDEQQAILHRAETDKATAEQAYNELEAASQSLGAMLRQRAADRDAEAAAAAAAAQAAASADSGSSDDGSYDSYTPVSGSGAMIWPVNGVVTSPFGYRNHPIFGRAILHSGVDIGVDYGTPVHAADGGVVVEAGWISGYGYAVVIDHGNGLSTLYGHNESLAVSSGQSVSQGQVIAYAGSTGNSTGPHVHFEVRANGDPVDPSSYL